MAYKYRRDRVMWWGEAGEVDPTPFYLSRRLNPAGVECGYVLGVEGCYEGLLPVFDKRGEAERLMNQLSKWYQELPPGCKSLPHPSMCLK